ncbi:TylF/MycF family methyltransferase [Aurantimonas litoralis]|nr:TylF/MycF family methyltransferase [Aurantimonas litoralis]
MKTFARSLFRNLGYDIHRIDTGAPSRSHESAGAEFSDDLRAQLSHSETMRVIHRRDTQEIEMLLRMVALPDLPEREGREAQLADLIGTNVCEALYLVDALHKAMKIEGDVCEFGVAQGATSQLIASEILATDRVFWLFDSFEGLPKPTKEDRLIDDIFKLGSMDEYAGTMMSPETEVLGRLAKVGFPRERLCVKKGWVNESIKAPEVPAKVAFAYVDFDFYEPIRDALQFLDERMAPGARIVVDDYGFFSEGAQLATDEFVEAMSGKWQLERPIAMAGHFVTLVKIK